MRIVGQETDSRKVFVSYSHQQGAWVHDRLVPVLRAGRAEVLIDRERFEAGAPSSGRWTHSRTQPTSLSWCFRPITWRATHAHELRRAVARDPEFTEGLVVPVKRLAVALPESIRQLGPLYAPASVCTRSMPPSPQNPGSKRGGSALAARHSDECFKGSVKSNWWGRR